MPEAKLTEMLGEAVTQIRVPPQVATDIIVALEADQSKLKFERQEEFNTASSRFRGDRTAKAEGLDDFKRGRDR